MEEIFRYIQTGFFIKAEKNEFQNKMSSFCGLKFYFYNWS